VGAWRLSPVGILRDVIGAYRRHWIALIATALVVFGVANTLDALLPELELDRFELSTLLGALAIGAAAGASHAFGEAFYEGVTAAEVVEWRTGQPTPRLSALVSSIPFLTLIAVNIVLAAGTGLGIALLLVPGVIFGTYTAIAPALVKIEHVGVRGSIRRSAKLVRGSFWRVLLILWGAYLLTLAVGEVIEHTLDHYAAEYVATTVAEALLAPFYGLAAVFVAFELLEHTARRS
jgi:hypothetical protein